MSDRPLGAVATSRPKRPYRPPIGIPLAIKENRWLGVLWSVALHALIIILVLLPLLLVADIPAILQGAGGPGPAGGGGGGSRGSGGAPVQERLQYIQVAPTPPAVVPPVVPPVVAPPVVVPPPQPVVPDVPKLEVKAELPAMPAVSLTAGTGGGTGNDGTAGNGPGSGGGVGSGIGTGRGSGTGPGTGGGYTANYSPTAIELFIPPMPTPAKVKGTQVVATFDVDSSGKVLSVSFTPTRDGGYNKKLKEVLNGIRFRPAVRPDGTPLRAPAQITYVLP